MLSGVENLTKIGVFEGQTPIMVYQVALTKNPFLF